MTLCLCRADVHGAPEGQGQRSLDSESIDVGLCGSDKVKGDHLQFFFFSDSQRAYGSKNKTKQNQKNTRMNGLNGASRTTAIIKDVSNLGRSRR